MRTSLNRPTYTPLSDAELAKLAKRAWLERQVLIVNIAKITDDWELQTIRNIGNRLYGADRQKEPVK
jgi:hypothetical protein